MAVMQTCSLKSTWRLRFQLESLKFLLCLQFLNGASMDPCGDNDKLSVKNLSNIHEVG